MSNEETDDFRKEYLEASETLRKLNAELTDAISHSRAISDARSSLEGLAASFKNDAATIAAALESAPTALESLAAAIATAQTAIVHVTPSEIMARLAAIESAVTESTRLKSNEMDQLRNQVKSLTDELAAKQEQLSAKNRQIEMFLSALKIIPEKMRRKWNLPTENDI